MADSAETAANKWQPYWDEKYQRYYWSDGTESVWETPDGCVEPPPPAPELPSHLVDASGLSSATTRYQPYVVPPTIRSTMNTGKRLVGQDSRDLRQLYHYFDYNAWNEELNRTDGNQKKKVKLTKKELDAIKARRAEIKRKHRDKWLLED